MNLWTEGAPLDKRGEGVLRSVCNCCRRDAPRGVVKNSGAELGWMRLESDVEGEEEGRLVIWECRTVAGAG